MNTPVTRCSYKLFVFLCVERTLSKTTIILTVFHISFSLVFQKLSKISLLYYNLTHI